MIEPRHRRRFGGPTSGVDPPTLRTQLDLDYPGGMKDSDIGRELGPEALNNYLEYKSIYASAAQLDR